MWEMEQGWETMHNGAMERGAREDRAMGEDEALAGEVRVTREGGARREDRAVENRERRREDRACPGVEDVGRERRVGGEYDAEALAGQPLRRPISWKSTLAIVGISVVGIVGVGLGVGALVYALFRQHEKMKDLEAALKMSEDRILRQVGGAQLSFLETNRSCLEQATDNQKISWAFAAVINDMKHLKSALNANSSRIEVLEENASALQAVPEKVMKIAKRLDRRMKKLEESLPGGLPKM